MKYVLKREDGKYVAIDGHVKSYTFDVRYIKTFHSLQEAKSAACGNEIVCRVFIN